MTDARAETRPPRHWSRIAAEIVAAFFVVMVAKGALAEPFYVPSGSMEPTLLIGDALLATKYPYGYGTASLPIHVALPASRRIFGAMPERGDVVVFRSPGDMSQVWVKRVIGLPGDGIQMRNGTPWINERQVDVRADGIGRAEDDAGDGIFAQRYVETLPGGRSHTIFKLRPHGFLDDTAEVTVPPDRLFVMGDNRDNSADSRVPVADGGVGLLPIENLVGRVDTIVGSWDFATMKQPLWNWLSGLRIARTFTAVH